MARIALPMLRRYRNSRLLKVSVVERSVANVWSVVVAR